ncbi:MAG: hypothetical protein Q8N23_27520 [Archangium sp.]|nr:hypothetical protein [Archangium sp.]MDP3573097.1 hypothetical protein [Archangium sp.]
MIVRSWVPLALLFCSCLCESTGYENRVFACQSDEDCIDGYRCLQDVCAMGAGDFDGGPSAGGAGGGGGGSTGGGGGSTGGGVGGGGGGMISCEPKSELCDGMDNDCDGEVDEGCTCDAGVTQACFTGPASACDGGTCSGVCRRGAQTCVADSDGGAGFGSCTGEVLPSPELCTDSLDNDCDDRIDCAQPSCLGQTCGANGRRCVGSTCTCRVDGGVTQPSETICDDLRDNDCNGLVDCQDPSCAAACAPVENCFDGSDNDGDALIDCGDPDCLHRSCNASAPASKCCGTVCLNLGNDPANCGQCGLVCPTGVCSPFSESGRATGRCACANLPGPGAGCSPQTPTTQVCAAGLCDCQGTDNACFSSGRCRGQACHYD